MNRRRVLVVDDDLSITKLVRANLQAEDYETLTAMDGVEAMETIERELPDLVILDVMMPKMDGLEVCRLLREWSQIPVIMLSARSDEEDKVRCLGAGADDYITKPFGVGELLARVEAVLRRADAARVASPQPSYATGDLEISFVGRRVAVAGEEVRLTATEYRILQELALNAGKVLTHGQLLQMVWGEEYSGETHLLHVFMARLRKKIRDGTRDSRYIVTRAGIGYLMRKPA